jgi:glutathione peroxidase
MATVYDYSAKLLSGEEIPLSRFKGKALLIVNTASKCGFTPQYAGLEKLYRTYGPRGFEVLGFPCNQFGGQEPGSPAQIGEFCSLNYDVTFPMFAKIDVNGPAAHPLYQYLKNAKRGLGIAAIKWNFTKFLTDRNGVALARFSPMAKPEDLEGSVAALV